MRFALSSAQRAVRSTLAKHIQAPKNRCLRFKDFDVQAALQASCIEVQWGDMSYHHRHHMPPRKFVSKRQNVPGGATDPWSQEHGSQSERLVCYSTDAATLYKVPLQLPKPKNIPNTKEGDGQLWRPPVQPAQDKVLRDRVTGTLARPKPLRQNTRYPKVQLSLAGNMLHNLDTFHILKPNVQQHTWLFRTSLDTEQLLRTSCNTPGHRHTSHRRYGPLIAEAMPPRPALKVEGLGTWGLRRIFGESSGFGRFAPRPGIPLSENQPLFGYAPVVPNATSEFRAPALGGAKGGGGEGGRRGAHPQSSGLWKGGEGGTSSAILRWRLFSWNCTL